MTPLSNVRSRLKSMGFRIHPSMPSLNISSRCSSNNEAETAKIGNRPFSFCERRLGSSLDSCSRIRIRSVAS